MRPINHWRESLKAISEQGQQHSAEGQRNGTWADQNEDWKKDDSASHPREAQYGFLGSHL